MSNIINKKNSNYKYNNKYNNKNNIFSIRNTLDLNTNSYDFNFKNKKYKSKNDFYNLLEHLNNFDDNNKIAPFFLPTLMEEKNYQ